MKRAFVLFMFLIIFSCSENEKKYILLTFIGDSHISNWDVNYWFPFSYNNNKGISGLTIDNLLDDGIKENYSGTKIIWIGINDIIRASREFDDNSTKLIKNSFDLLTDSLDYGDCVLSIVPVTSFYKDKESVSEINRIVLEMNDYLKIICAKKNIVYVDIYSVLTTNLFLNKMYSLDGLHLNNLGYELVSKEVRSNIY